MAIEVQLVVGNGSSVGFRNPFISRATDDDVAVLEMNVSDIS